jgi:hypothetical protein
MVIPNIQTRMIRWNMLAPPLRQFVIDVVKAPLQAAIIHANRLLNGKVGEPVKGNTLHPHSRQLIELRDWFMANEDNTDREELFRAAWNILIYEVEHDPYYGFRFNRILAKLVEKVNSGEWKFESHKPDDDFCWKEFKK